MNTDKFRRIAAKLGYTHVHIEPDIPYHWRRFLHSIGHGSRPRRPKDLPPLKLLRGRALDRRIHAAFQRRGPVLRYSSRIEAAWKIDRPEWRWEFSEDQQCVDVELWMPGGQINYTLVTRGKPTAKDVATARCLVALQALADAEKDKNDEPHTERG